MSKGKNPIRGPEFALKIAKTRFPSTLIDIPIYPIPSLYFQFKIANEFYQLEPTILQHQGDFIVITDGIEGLRDYLSESHIEFIVVYGPEVIGTPLTKYGVAESATPETMFRASDNSCFLILYE
jgi:hypothetical protein